MEPLIFVLVCLGITLLVHQRKQQWVIFNSHTAPDHPNAAAFIVCPSFNEFQAYVNQKLFPVAEMEAPQQQASLQEMMANFADL